MGLREEIKELHYAISADIEHGECFYDFKMMNEFCDNIDSLKKLAIEYFLENKEEDEENE